MLENATPDQMALYRTTLQPTGRSYGNLVGEAFTEMGEYAIRALNALPHDTPTPGPGPAPQQVNVQRTRAGIVRVTPGRLVGAV